MRFYSEILWDRQDQKENKDPLVRREHKAQRETPEQQGKMVPMALTEKAPTKWLWKTAMLARNYNG